jgi:hypothetical protein
METIYPNNDKMSPEISVLIRKNSHEVIRVTSILLLLQIVVTAFSTRFLKTSIVSIGIECTKSFMYPHKK